MRVEFRARSLVLVSALLCFAGLAEAAGDLHTAFELDGNVVDNSPGSPSRDDWETLLSGGSANVKTLIPIVDAVNGTIFGGGDKDIQDYPAMSWTDNSVPDKDDISNAAAAAYKVGDDLIIYFVADRYATAGDAYIGAWFHKDTIGLSSGGFTGKKSIGDILVLINFVNGGTVPVVEVLEWDPVACPSKDPGNSENFGVGQCPGNNLQILYKQSAKCALNGPNGTACAIANVGGEAAVWTFESKSGGPPGIYPVNSLFEGAINISALLGTNACFASFLIETRASSSETAQLKDFVLGSFPLCRVTISKQCSDDATYDPNLGYIPVPWTVLVQNDGFAPVSNVVVTDNNCGLGGTTVLNTGSIAAGGSKTVTGACQLSGAITGVLRNGASAVADNGNIPVALAESCTTFSNQPGVCFDSCGFNTSPSLMVTKACTTRLDSTDGIVKVLVDYTGTVTNTSDTEIPPGGSVPVPTPLNFVSVQETLPETSGPLTLYPTAADAAAGTNAVGTSIGVLPGETFYFTGSYTPSAPDDPNAECASDAEFTDQVSASGEDVFTGQSTSDTADATCNLCTDCSSAPAGGG